MRYLTFVEQAIARLGYVRPQYAGVLAVLMEEMEGYHPRDIGRTFRQHGTPLTAVQKREKHIRANTDLTLQAWEALTEKGRANPVHGIDTMLLDAAFQYFRHRSVSGSRDVNSPHDFIIDGIFSADCEGCQRLNGKHVSAEFIAEIPPSDCQREACALGMRLRVDLLAGIR